MFNRDKPLFSRPVLAAIIVATTLAVWLLNLTSPHIDLATPSLETWETSSGIPVYWLTQDDWEGSDKLSLSIVFNTDTQSSLLTSATLSLLTGPSLPLSTATINQRLTPIAAKVDTYYSIHQQQINLTMSSRPQFLSPTLNLFDTWLNQTQFKNTALQHWQRRQHKDLGQQQLMLQLWPKSTIQANQLTISELTKHFTLMKQQVSHIMVAGALNDAAKKQFKQDLDNVTRSMQKGAKNNVQKLATTPAISELGRNTLSAIYGGIGIQPLSSVADWVTIQIWAKDSLQEQKKRLNSQTGQWQLHFERPQPYINWQIQVPPSVLQEEHHSSSPHSSWIPIDQLPSYNEAAAFNILKQQLLQQLSTLSNNPTWWRAIGAGVAMPDTRLTLEDFVEHYSDTANSFTIEQYQQRLKQLLIPSSRQEVLIKL